MSDIHVEVVLTNKNGIAKDEFITSLNYTCEAVDSAGATAAITSFFNDVGTDQTEAICWYLSQYVSRTVTSQIRYYDKTGHLDGSPSGGPFQVDTFTVGAIGGGSAPWPNQDTATLSYYDELDSEGTTMASKRGRMFIGPLGSVAGVIESTGGLHLTTQFCDDLGYALRNLSNALLAAVPPKALSVWSRKDSSMTQAIGAFVQNKVDTQRRRAYGPNLKSTVTFP